MTMRVFSMTYTLKISDRRWCCITTVRCDWINAMEDAWYRGDILCLPALHFRHQIAHSHESGQALCIAQGHYLMGEFGECIKALSQYSAKGSQQLRDYWELLMKARIELRHYTKALIAAETLLELSSADVRIPAEAYAIKYIVLDARGYGEQARLYAQKAVNHDPVTAFHYLPADLWREYFPSDLGAQDVHDERLYLIKEYMKAQENNDYATAFDIVYELIKHPPINPRIFGLLLRFLYFYGRNMEAQEVAERVKQAFPKSMIPYTNLYFYCSDYVEKSTLIDSLLKAIEIEPSCGYLHYLLGRLYRAMDKRSMLAFLHTRRALDLFAEQDDLDVLEYGLCAWIAWKVAFRNVHLLDALDLFRKQVQWVRRVPNELVERVTGRKIRERQNITSL